MENKNTPIKKDWFMLGLVTGIAGSITKSIVNYAIEKAGIPTVRYGSIAASAVLGKKSKLGGLFESKPKSFGEKAIGYASDTILGGLFGAGLSYIYSKTPPGNEFTKGAIGGASLWASTLILGNQMNLEGLTKLTPAKMATLLGTSMLFGGLQGLIIGKYGTRLISQSHPILTTNVTLEQFEQNRFINEE